ACDPDTDLRAEVERLLAAHAAPDSILEPAAPDPAAVTGTFGADPPDAAPTADLDPGGATGTFGEAPPVARGPGPAAGAVIAGRYTLREVIGEGGMGSV